jgi:hypothetical protein
MGRLTFLLLLIPLHVFAAAPECPIYANKQECLVSVEENYTNFLDFIESEYEKEGQDELIQAANDIKFYETLACQKTCLN